MLWLFRTWKANQDRLTETLQKYVHLWSFILTEYIEVLKVWALAYIVLKLSYNFNPKNPESSFISVIGEVSILNDLSKILIKFLTSLKEKWSIGVGSTIWFVIMHSSWVSILTVLTLTNILYYIFIVIGSITCIILLKCYMYIHEDPPLDNIETELQIDYMTDKINLLKKIWSQAPIPLFVTNLSSIEFTSKSAKSMLEYYGITKKRDILKAEFVITGSETPHSLKLKDIIMSVKEELPQEIRIERKLKTGEMKYYDFKVDSFKFKDQELFVLLMNDITYIKYSEEEQAIKKLKALMFASMTHEIRTPLNAIINSCDVIQTDPNITSSINECVEICKSSASLLMYMTFNILDYSRMESGEFREEYIPFEIWTLLEKIALISEPHARLKKLTFQLDIEEGLDEIQIYNDERRIIQVLLNLIMNSVKYTFRGKIRLKIRLVNVSSRVGTNAIDKPYLVFSVIDTGQGISEEKQDKLFQLFSNVENYDDHTENTSLGLELTVSKNIIENMGGRLWFTSKLNIGTVFTFAIPQNIEENDSEDAEQESDIITQNLSKLIFHDPMAYFEEYLKELEEDDYRSEENDELLSLNSGKNWGKYINYKNFLQYLELQLQMM